MNDRFDEMRLFVRIVEMRSFRRAAEALGIPASTASDVVKRTEARLGVQLLSRTTRIVAPTLEGEAWYASCLRIVHDVEDAEAGFRQGEAEGRLRVDVHGTLARHFLLPRLPGFLDAYPGIELIMSEGDRLVDLLREGVDCVVRVGTPVVSDLVVRRLGRLREITAASPDYLARHGTPSLLGDLDSHRMIGFLSSQTGRAMPLYFTVGGQETEHLIRIALQTSSAETMVAAAKQGIGIVQVPRYHVVDDLDAGRLVEILADHEPSASPVSALFPRGRQSSPRLRAFLDWVIRISFDT